MPSFQDVILKIPGITHYYALDDNTKAQDLVGNVNGKINGNVTFGANGASFDGRSSIELADHNDFSAAGTSSKALTIIAFQTVTDWTKQSHNNEYVHWMGKGRDGGHEWTFRYYIDGGSGEAASRRRRTSFYHFNPSGGLGAGSYFQDEDAAGYERVIGGQVWGNSGNGGSTQMWKNGVVRDTDALSGYNVNPQNTNTPVFLGSRGDGTGFLVGRLRRVAFFNRRLTDAEMKQIYDARGYVESEAPVEPPPQPLGDIYVDGAPFPLAGLNVARNTGSLVIYNDAYGSKTDTNEWGAEAVVTDRRIVEVLDQRTVPIGQHNLTIPKGSHVLSGHGEARTWLLSNATVGAFVSFNDPTVPEPEPEGPDLSDEIANIRAKAAALRVLADEVDAIADSIESKSG